ncbi:hypothetical protein [Lactococcus garvieae]|uniref:Uncharacterized protein n=1 Tax=Lactococcus garvieae TaxID=1363 RepID=A0AA46YQW0_9LACT|nr:hypothetical protein [Lactococcus garvieae]UYT09852.1 hypothetical protein OF801_07690 [Lactococcus garvieae]UYT11825.1 hypothetical protein OF800_07350 [Lactococcus garvieae]
MFQLSKENLLHILALTEQGGTEILKKRAWGDTPLRNKLDVILELSFNGSVDFILDDTEVLKSSIIIRDDKILVGFNAEETRMLVPKSYRKVTVEKGYFGLQTK